MQTESSEKKIDSAKFYRHESVRIGVMNPKKAMFVEGSVIGITTEHPKEQNLVFVNTVTPETVENWPPDSWQEVDCSALVPADTKAVGLTTMLLITQGEKTTQSDLILAVRRKGSTQSGIEGNYHAQTTCYHAGDGRRTTDTIWVALSEDLKFEVFWSMTPGAALSYGINMNLFGYVR